MSEIDVEALTSAEPYIYNEQSQSNWINYARETGSKILHSRWLRIALGVAVLTACEPKAPDFTGKPGVDWDGYNVALLGDSQLVMAENGDTSSSDLILDDQHQLLSNVLRSHGDHVSAVARVGAQITDVAHPTDGHFNGWPSIPDKAVTGLGTNDVRLRDGATQPITPIANAEDDYDLYLRNTGARCNVLVGVVETPAPDWHMDVYGPQFNQFLKNEAAIYNGIYIDWASTVKKYPQLLAPDGIHPSKPNQGNGMAVYRLLIKNGLDQCNATTPTTTTTTTTTTSTTTTPVLTTTTSTPNP